MRRENRRGRGPCRLTIRSATSPEGEAGTCCENRRESPLPADHTVSHLPRGGRRGCAARTGGGEPPTGRPYGKPPPRSGEAGTCCENRRGRTPYRLTMRSATSPDGGGRDMLREQARERPLPADHTVSHLPRGGRRGHAARTGGEAVAGNAAFRAAARLVRPHRHRARPRRGGGTRCKTAWSRRPPGD